MNKKHRGFTAVEMIVVLSLIVIISAVIYTFFSTNNKMLQGTKVRSDLQTEGERTQNRLIYVGANGYRLTGVKDASTEDGVSITSLASSDQSVTEFEIAIPKADVEEVDLSKSDTYLTYKFKLEGSRNKINARKLVLYDPTKKDDKTGDIVPETLSENVEEVTIKPINSTSCSLNDCTGLKVTVKLHKKKGFSDITYPIETNLKFRNFDK